MAGRRYLLAVVLLAAVLHAISIARSLLPAQDGLKFIRVARQFQTDPWPDVVRDTDQHPLYPALIAAAEPVVSASSRARARHLADRRPGGRGPGLAGHPLPPLRPDADRSSTSGSPAWRSRIYALLPVPAEVGHDTLSDSLGLLADAACRCAGARSRSGPATGGRPWPPGLAGGRRLPGPPRSDPGARSRSGWPGSSSRRDRRRLRAALASPRPSCRPWASRSWSRSAAMPWSRARSRRSSRCGTGPRWARSRSRSGRCPSSGCPRAWTIRDGISRPRKRPSTRSRSAARCKALRVDGHRMVGRALLGFRRHGRLGPGPPAVHPRPLPATAIRDRLGDGPSDSCSPSSRRSSSLAWSGTPRASGISRAGTRFPGPDLGPVGGGGDVRLPPRAGA